MTKFRYYFWATYRRKMIDRLLNRNKSLFQGVVLDIGGRDRGMFKKPKDKVTKWIFADSEAKHQPDLVLDVADMSDIDDSSIDVISAMELFEHVLKIDKGLIECHRVLKSSGKFILSVPFMYQIHADPYDYQRWTKEKWQLALKDLGFEIEQFVIMGRFFTLQMEMKKKFVKQLPYFIKVFAYMAYPIFDLLIKLDNLPWVKNNKVLGNYHGGYFIVCKKK